MTNQTQLLADNCHSVCISGIVVKVEKIEQNLCVKLMYQITPKNSQRTDNLV